MSNESAKTPNISIAGIIAGGVALMLALVHFWAGPFAPRPSVERTVAETAVAIRDATVSALRGDEIEERAVERKTDIDDVIQTTIPVLGGLALILGVAGLALGEPLRAGAGAAVLGGAAVAFQFAALAVGMIVLAILIGSVIAKLDFFDL